MAEGAPRGRAVLLRRSLPPLYERSEMMGGYCDAVGRELDLARGGVLAILGEMFPQTATFTLASWEWLVGLGASPVFTDEERRARVLARTRVKGTATPGRVKDVANSFGNGRVELIEDFAAGRVLLRFADVRGRPTQVDDLVAAVREVLPDDLELVTEFTYTTWEVLEAAGPPSWDALDGRGLTFDQLETAY